MFYCQCRCLIAHGANLNAKDAMGLTPLLHASSRGDREMIQTLKGYSSCNKLGMESTAKIMTASHAFFTFEQPAEINSDDEEDGIDSVYPTYTSSVQSSSLVSTVNLMECAPRQQPHTTREDMMSPSLSASAFQCTKNIILRENLSTDK